MKRRALITTAVVLLGLAACDTDTVTSAADDPAPASTDTTTPATEPPDTEPAAPDISMPDWCVPAELADLDAVQAALAGSGNTLADAFTVTDAAGYRYLVANINDAAGERLSSADIWIFDPEPGPLGPLFAASSSAEEYSILPSAENLPAADPFGPDVYALTDCVIASAQLRNAAAAGAAPSGGECDPNYEPCVPPAEDVDCAGGDGDGPAYVEGPVSVVGDDVYGLDPDGDGVGCN